ncbi:MAG TPA: phosphatase PAP2 family protein [Thermoanaerobaculia bacterium]
MSIDARRRAASIAFVALLVLSVWWPSPIVSVNRLCCNASLGIDELSFLGRESPSWDVAFWWIAILFALILFQDARDFGSVGDEIRDVRVSGGIGVVVAVVAAAALVAVLWFFADAPITAWAERINSDKLESWIRIANRFGGGLNPVMIIAFFLLAGMAYANRRWIRHAIQMAIAGAFAGIVVQVLKLAVGRTRPELWLGPFHHARASASSFPSGHTVGAFALAGVLILSAESRTLRVIAALLAFAVALSRVLAFRHWTSDVAASAAIGLLVAATLRSPRS